MAVEDMANSIGCVPSKVLFTYLGLMVGDNMSRIASWDVVILKVTSKLSNWNAKNLSVGERLTLLKSILDAISIYFMFLFRAPEFLVNHIESFQNSFFLGANL